MESEILSFLLLNIWFENSLRFNASMWPRVLKVKKNDYSFHEGCDCEEFLAQVDCLLAIERRCKNEQPCERDGFNNWLHIWFYLTDCACDL